MKQDFNVEKVLTHYWDVIIGFSVKIASALIVLAIGIFVIRFITNLVRKLFEKREIDPTVTSFLLSIISWLLKLILFIAVISKLGIETSSFIAILGTMGIAIGLSLQGALSNFTGGLLIIMFKPFRIGDAIVAQGTEGTVRSIQIFNTEIVNDNNQVIYIPNGILSNGIITNFSKETNRRASIKIVVSTKNDLQKVNDILTNVLKKNDKVLNNPKPTVNLSELIDDTATFNVNPWALRVNYLAMTSEILSEIKKELENENIILPNKSIELVNKK